MALMVCGVFQVTLNKINIGKYEKAVNKAFSISLKDMLEVKDIRVIKLIIIYYLKKIRKF